MNDHNESDRSTMFAVQRQPGDLLFALLVLALAIFLLLNIGDQTRWFNRVDLLLQPRFWPLVILVPLTVFAGAYVVGGVLARRNPDSVDRHVIPLTEIALWLRALEYTGYFLLYAASIPWLGYLLATVLFMPLLGWRAGVRSGRGLGLLVLLALGIVLFFKTGLQVRMPPGALYDLLPPDVRNFLIRNF